MGLETTVAIVSLGASVSLFTSIFPFKIPRSQDYSDVAWSRISSREKKGKDGRCSSLPQLYLMKEWNGMEACPGPRLWQMSLSGILTVCPTSKEKRESEGGWKIKPKFDRVLRHVSQHKLSFKG